MKPSQEVVSANVKAALQEDLAGQQDITAQLVPASKQAAAHVLTRESAVICGQAWVNEVFKQIDPKVKITWEHKDGDLVEPNDVIYKLEGNARSLLTGERTALNFLQMLSATATLTHKFVQKLAGTKAKLLDCRKTIPGLRLAQKYAVICGGGYNHRMGLYDAFLIKENHIRACGSITKAIAAARAIAPRKKVELEVENLADLIEAFQAKTDIIMLDNFSIDQMAEAVGLNQGQAKLEASGNIVLANIDQVAATGVDFISVGLLTKNVKAIDFSMQFDPSTKAQGK